MAESADDLADVILAAIAAHLAETGGGMVTSLAACMEYLDADGDRCWAVAHNDRQSPSTTLGLLRWHTINVEQQCIALMSDDDE